MKKFILSLVVAVSVLVLVQHDAHAGGLANRWGERFARTLPWHGDYYYGAWGTPVALVVPPVSHMQNSMGWGVAQTSIHPIYHQFRRDYPGQILGSTGTVLCPTPRWPSHTDQFGVYYVRGPW